MQKRDQIYVDGQWVASDGDGSIDVINPSNEEVIGSVPAGTAVDVDAAVAAARSAFDGWAATPLEDRLALIEGLAGQLGARMGEIGTLISDEMGMPRGMSTMIQAGMPTATTGGVPATARDFAFEETINRTLVTREPVGVVGCITPWNFPLHQVMAKVAPALAVGCTVVLKPSEVAPLSAFLLAEIIDDLGFPPGVFNLVSGVGPVVGEAIAAHPDVDMVSFTGSTRAGTRVAEVAAVNVTRVHQELGGKSANIILEDADLSAAIPAAVGACYLNSGQTCSALTRLLVPADKMDEVAALAAEAAAGYSVGPADDDGSRLGPLVSAAQWERVQGYIQTGIDEGATLVAGGTGKPDGLDAGYYVKPTVFANVSNSMTIAREEIFGPVLSIIGYTDVDDAVALANDTEYGLAGGVWGTDTDKALEVAKRLRTGQVDMNGAFLNTDAPFGGYKKSGNGRELGRYGLAEFVESKSINLPMG
ncbi:MAG: aldehyde dehydrogenase family protein [Acidimicrobiales bacterium]|jgi:aldehyde dehydrogenase (NAD+)|nr:aldehyde dehydrogenase family protein [Acidimicrobiaceae bacterium]MBT5206600.1 aldehyde dehydrogenase family protein [Acidimicrobiaceae bacterium]MBT5567658.1 aldehyde dehydrogenase family protein [Acidimicrobiaceae bacterium]MBT6091418.1 aldehyde dehydrogenase family protein [Acidimicrobiaceae bacterium]MDG2161108.1 aldehyde dehydrogenase family protein [Acidimicrobiales bacterium]